MAMSCLYLVAGIVALLAGRTTAVAPVVVPIGGNQQVAVSPEPHNLTFNVTPPVIPSNISWTHHNGLNSETIDENANTFLSFSPDRLTLTLSLPLSQNEGTYTLTATNEDGSNSSSITLDIKSRPAFITLPSSQNKHERENVTFPCFATGDPTPSIEWIFNDTLVINSSNEKYQIGLFGESNFGSLTVQDLEFPNTGVYICRASNQFGSLNATAVELGVQVLPSITSQPSDIAPVAGGTAYLRCSVRGFPPVNVYWTKNITSNVTELDSVVRYTTNSVYNHSTLTTHSTLTLNGPVLSTDGNYTCTATNSLKSFESTTSMEAEVLVQYPPATSVSDSTVRVNQSFSTTFNCSSFGIPPPSLFWYFNGNNLETGGNVVVTRTSFVNESDLYIRSIELAIDNADRAAHEGSYTCVAVNNVDNLISSPENVTTQVFVQVPPRLVLPNGSSVLGVVGSSVTLRFQVEDASPDVLPERTFWSFQDVPLSSNLSDRFVYSVDRRSLTINDLTHEDEGLYSVTVTNEAGTDSSEINLQIEAAPVLVSPFLTDSNVLQGNSTELRCSITSEPQPNVQWLFNSNPVNLSISRLSVGFFNGSEVREYYSVLSISEATMEETGDYTCLVTNVHGTVNNTAHVEVQIPPIILQDPNDTLSIRGFSVSLSCQTFGSPTPNITWLKGSMTVTSSPFINITYTRNGFTRQSVLTFLNLSFSDAEYYTCLAQNDLVTLTSSNSTPAQLIVNQPPLLASSTDEFSIFNQSQIVNISCHFLGLPPPFISWSRSDSANLSDSVKFTTFIDSSEPPEGGVISSSTLQVTDVGESDTGNYTCTAVNRATGPMEPLNLTTHSLRVLVQTSPLVNLVSAQTEIGVLTRNITLVFSVSRDVPAVVPVDIKWFLNGTEILPDERHVFSDSRESLSIYNLTLPFDEGEYSLVASNIIGNGTESLFLDVEIAPIITSNSGTVNTIEGHNATFHCLGVSEPVHFTGWRFNGTNISTDSIKYSIFGNNTSNSTLVVHNVSLTDQGEYACHADNVHGVDSAVSVLFVQVPPYISNPPSSSTIRVNTSATFRCCSGGIPLPSIQWLKNGTIIDEANRISFTIQESINENCSVLNIANPVFGDRGEYVCISTNQLAEELMATSDPVELIVQYPPEVFPLSQDTYTRNESDSFTIECTSFGVPLPALYWVPGPFNITSNIGNGDLFLTNGELASFLSSISDYPNRLVNLTEQCPVNRGPSVCRDNVGSSNDTSVECDRINGSLCPVSCGIDITSYNETRDDGTPVSVSRLTLCSLLKTEELSYTCVAFNNVTNDIGTHEAVSANLVVQVKPYVFSSQTETQVAFRGHSTTLHFNISLASPDVPPEGITWSFTHRFLDISEIITGSGDHYEFSESHRSLTLYNLTTNDTGSYELTATNPAGTDRHSIELSVQALPEIISSTSSPVITVTGRREHLDCFADGSPLQNVSWTFTNASGVPLFEIGFLIDNDTARTGYTEYTPLVEDINELYIMEKFSISNNTVPSAMEYGRLSIADINAFDAGMYNCTLTNIYNLMDPDTYSVQVQVQLYPSILTHPQSTQCTSGASCSLNCTVAGVPAPIINWYHDGTLVNDHSIEFTSTYNQTTSILNIASVDLADSGRYHCIGNNTLYSNESDSSNEADLTVLYPSEVFSLLNHTITNETFTATLTCMVTGYPRPTVTWYIGSRRLASDNKYVIADVNSMDELLYNVTSVLNISNVNKSDETVYTCSSENGVSNNIGVNRNATSQLTIQVPPTVVGMNKDSVVKGSEIIISFNITRASPLVSLDDIIWSFTSINNESAGPIILNVTCAEMENATCVDSQRYQRYNFTFDHDQTTLTIQDAQVKDYGTFTLNVSNPAGMSSSSHLLRVIVPALLNSTHMVFNETKNQLNEVINITMNCTADGIPKPGIIWFYDDAILNLKPRVTIIQQDLNSTIRPDVIHPNGTAVISILSITNANQIDDSGKYACQAENIGGGRSVLDPPNSLIINVDTEDFCRSSPCENGGTCINLRDKFLCRCRSDDEATYSGETCQTRVEIEIAPTITSVTSIDMFVPLFGKVTLVCSARGAPEPTVQWFRNNEPIQNSLDISSTNYVIQEIRLEDRGDYHCEASNAAGSIKSDTILVNIDNVIEYIANLTVQASMLREGVNITSAADTVVNTINSGIAGEAIGSNSTFFFIVRDGLPLNRTTNITVPIRITIRLQEDTPNDILRQTVENRVRKFGHHLEISDNQGVRRFNYCPPDTTDIPSPDGDPTLILTIRWPEILYGKLQNVSCPCDFQLSSTALLATRNCGGNLITGADWERPNIQPCNFSVTTRQLCRLANLSSFELLNGLDNITGNIDKIDSAGVTVSATAIDSVVDDVISNDTLVNSTMNVFNNIQGVSRQELVIAQRTSDSSGKMLRSLFNITNTLPANTTILRDRMVIMTGDSLNSSISSSPNSTSDATIMIPDGFIRDNSNASFVVTVFTSDSLFIPNEDDGSTVGTSILDFTLPDPDIDVSDLEEPIQLMFPNFTPPTDGNLVPVCEFWDTENNKWSREGCMLVGENTCSCNHLTSFAILLDVAAEEPPTAVEAEVFEYITYIGLTVSIICLIVTLITYLGTPKLRKSEASQLLIHLSFALLGLYFTFIIAAQGDRLTGPVCGIIGALVHYFFLAVFFIMAAESVDLFIKLVIVLGPKIQRFIIKTAIIGWIAPLFVVLFCFVPDSDHYIHPHYCGPSGFPLYIGIFLPFSVIYIFNYTIFFIIMISLIKKSASSKFSEAKKKNRKAEVKKQCRVAFTVSVLFGLGWGFGILASSAIGSTPVRIIFNSIFTIFTVFQGFFIFLLYIVLSPNARGIWKRWILRKEATKSTDASSSVGPSTSRTTQKTNASNNYGRKAGGVGGGRGTLYKNVYSAAKGKSSSPYITKDLISSEFTSSQPVVEELKERLRFRSIDDEDEDRTFMNPLEDLGDVMSLVSDTQSLHETTFSFPNPNPPSQEEDDEERDDLGDIEEGPGKCSTFKNPLRQSLHRTTSRSSRPPDETELLSQSTTADEPIQTVALDLNAINGFTMSNGSSSLSQSQGLSGHDGSLLIRDEQVSEL